MFAKTSRNNIALLELTSKSTEQNNLQMKVQKLLELTVALGGQC